MISDFIADLLTRIRNAQRAGHKTVKVSASRLSKDVLDVLKKEGFIDSFKALEQVRGKGAQIEVLLKYFGPYEPAITQARRISTSGCRVYVGSSDVPKVSRGLGICVLSTSQGVMSDREAKRRKIGGELLASIA